MLIRLLQLLRWSLGYAIFDLYRTWRKVQGREHLRRADTEGLGPIEVARACLASCLEQRRVGPGRSVTVLCAGFRHFREPWARDFGFACFGLLAEGKTEVVRDGIRLFFGHQNGAGQLPLKLHSTRLLERYLHSLLARVQPAEAELTPRYWTAHGTRSLDSVLLLVIAWGECCLQTQDRDLAADLRVQARRALAWVEANPVVGGLLLQGPFADWADSIGRRGAVLYTQVLWWKARQSLERVERDVLGVEAAGDLHPSHEIGARILECFYRPEAGYLTNTPTSPVFTSAGNFMAVAWGLTDEVQSQSILDYAQAHGLSEVVPCRVTDRAYPWYQVSPLMWLAGIPHYHTSCSWMWIGAWHAVANQRVGRQAEAGRIVDRMLEVVARDRTVYEVHDPSGEPLARFLYHSEEPLSWNAAMLLYAVSEVGRE